jgi:ribosomal protein S18 acetylase RimI-like enzyme
MKPAVRIEGVPLESRITLHSILEECFSGLYRWHAKRVLSSVRWVRQATQGNTPVGLAMLRMISERSGYLYYVAVIPSRRRAGLGGLLLDDALRILKAEGAGEVLACVRSDNAPSLRLFRSRGFKQRGFFELVRRRGFLKVATLWMRMVAVPGEKVLLRTLRSPQRSG